MASAIADIVSAVATKTKPPPRRPRGHGSIVWRGSVPYAVYRVDGRQVWERYDTLEDAEQRLIDVRKERKDGSLSAPSSMTFKEYADRWFRTRGGVIAASTRHGYELMIRHHFIPAFGAEPLKELTAYKLETYRAAKLGETDTSPPITGKRTKVKLSAQAVRNQLILLGQILEAARRDGFINKNPMDDVKLPKVNREEPIPLTPDDLVALLDETPERHRALMAVLGYQGLRLNEALALRCGDFIPKTRRLHIRRGLTREGSRRVPGPPKTPRAKRALTVSEPFAEMLREHIGSLPASGRNALMFPNQAGNLMSGDNFRNRVFKPAAARAGIDEQATVHTLRHTFAAMSIARNVNPKLLSRRMGHASVAFTLETYAHLYDEQLAEDSDAFAG